MCVLSGDLQHLDRCLRQARTMGGCLASASTHESPGGRAAHSSCCVHRMQPCVFLPNSSMSSVWLRNHDYLDSVDKFCQSVDSCLVSLKLHSAAMKPYFRQAKQGIERITPLCQQRAYAAECITGATDILHADDSLQSQHGSRRWRCIRRLLVSTHVLFS